MKISKAIFATDDNPRYDGLWPIVSEICFKKLGVTPVLFKITDHDTDFIQDEFGLIKNIKKIDNIDTGRQSQIVRMWATKFFPNEVCIISDIDMLMFNKEYFIDQVAQFKDDDLVIYCSDAYDTKRPECVGIYSNRYPICYNAATGSTFNKILNTSCSFEEYINKILSIGYPDFDADELYYAHCVDNIQHGVNIIKLIRGFYSKFKCPKRIDRIDDDTFNTYDQDLLSKDYYIDCHLARPFIKHKREIDKLKKLIMNDEKEVYLIGAHIDNEIQEKLLSNLVQSLIDNGKDYIISTHCMIPNWMIENSVGFIYDSINPKYKIWDLPNKDKYELDMGSFKISSPYITYGRVDYYHVGVLRQIANGLNLIRTMDYKIVHWMDYDAMPDYNEEKLNLERLNSYDFIFYGIGAKFSFKINKVNQEILNYNNDDFLRILSENDYVVEKVFSEKLINGSKLFIPVTEDRFFGKYSQNFDYIKFDWSLFRNGDEVSIFLINHDNKKINFKINCLGGNSINIDANSNVWYLQSLGNKNNLTKFNMVVNDQEYVQLDLSDITTFKNVVDSVDIKFN